MAILLSSRRIAWLGVFLVALGVVEYMVVSSIHNEREGDGPRLPDELFQGKPLVQAQVDKKFSLPETQHRFQSESRIRQKESQAVNEALNIEAHGDIPERVPHKQFQAAARPHVDEKQRASEADNDRPRPRVMQLSKPSRNVDPPRQFAENDFEVKKTQDGPKLVKKPPIDYGPEILVENNAQLVARPLTPFETNGGDILFTLRTTGKYHDKRLPLLYETWMTKVNHSNIFVVTDRWDQKWTDFSKAEGTHYVNAECGNSYLRDSLCCKAGVEMGLLFQQGNEHYNWLCHVDDDMYVIGKQLVKTLSKFNPTTEPVYFGRSGSAWQEPRPLMKSSKIGTPGKKYHFAVGGMYCLSRAMLELAKAYLVGGKAFAKSCSQTREPEDVTVGVVVGAVLNLELSRTELIHTHGLFLGEEVNPLTLAQQVAFSYGFGVSSWQKIPYNVIPVPNAVFTPEEDNSQFRSLHCHLYPDEQTCVEAFIKKIQSL